MLKYYSYYSVGGYKDFLLGDSESKNESTFYFPLLPILEERAKNDSEAAKQVAELKVLPAIKQLSTDDSYGLPSSAKVLFSHAGYKLIYKHLEGNKYALALRDISQNAKDETGSSIPFMFVIVGNESTDIHALDALTTYMACNIKRVEQLLSQLLYRDVDKNGLRFDLSKFNKWIEDVVKTNPSTTLPCITGEKEIHAKSNKVALLLLPKGISKEKAITEQNIVANEALIVPLSEVISKEDPDRLIELILNLSKQLQDEKKRNELLKKRIIAAGIGGCIAGGIIASFCLK